MKYWSSLSSSSSERQLAIYALMHEVEMKVNPGKVGILFLKFDLDSVMIDVDERLINIGKSACEDIKEGTKTDDIKDYPYRESGLCKWSNPRGKGQCDFYDEYIKERQCSI